MMNNPYQKYQEQMVTTMTQGDMLMKLYDEALRQIEIAKNCINNKNIPDMDKANQKAQRIFTYLRSCLDFRFPISNALAHFYDFFNQQLVYSNIRKDVKPLDEISPLVLDLRNTFEQADRMDRASRSVTSRAGVV